MMKKVKKIEHIKEKIEMKKIDHIKEKIERKKIETIKEKIEREMKILLDIEKITQKKELNQ